MRLALLTAVTAAAGLSACVAPPPAGPYGYAPAAAPVADYGYGGGYYAPSPGYYAEPGYAPYVAPGPAIIIGSERRYEGDRYRYERSREDGRYRGNPQQGRDFRPQPGRPGPQPFAAGRPGPGPGPGPQPGRPGPGPSPGPAPNSGFNPSNPTAQGGADR